MGESNMNPIATIFGATALLSVALAGPSLAQDTKPLKIGVLSDFSSVYSDIGGMGNVEATKMAIEEMGSTMFSKPTEVVAADVRNKGDIPGALARKWYGNGNGDMIIDMPPSATALAGMEMSKQF